MSTVADRDYVLGTGASEWPMVLELLARRIED